LDYVPEKSKIDIDNLRGDNDVKIMLAKANLDYGIQIDDAPV